MRRCPLLFYKHYKSDAAKVGGLLLSMLFMAAFSVLLLSGCDEDDDKNSFPAADISGIWNGSNSDGDNISFMFVQSSSGHISGTASFLGPINGRLSNRTLSIEGADLKAILSSDNTTFRGSYTQTNGFAVNFAVSRSGGPAPEVVETPSGGGGSGDPIDDGNGGGGNGNGDTGDDDGDDDDDGDGGGGGGPPMPPG